MAQKTRFDLLVHGRDPRLERQHQRSQLRGEGGGDILRGTSTLWSWAGPNDLLRHHAGRPNAALSPIRLDPFVRVAA